MEHWTLIAVGVVALFAAGIWLYLRQFRSFINQRRTLFTASEEQSKRVKALEVQVGSLEAVLDGMAEGVWVTDAQGLVTQHNAALKQMLYSGQELVGQRPLSVLRNEALHQAVVNAGQRGEVGQLELLIKGVRPRTLTVQVRPLGHDMQGSVAVFHDVTELRRLEKVRTDFVANISHELRTPITAIRGYAETLQSGALSDPEHASKMIEIIHRQSERLSQLVGDLLELSRVEAGELKLEKTAVPLLQIADRAAEAIRPKAANKGIDIDISLSSTLFAFADASATEQVLLNLLDNAVKYTPAGGRVEVSGSQDADRCVMTVRDSGPGIEAKHLPRLFERFYRVDSGRSRDMGGTGLGLSIVKHLLSEMGGSIAVSSDIGVGTTFNIDLPTSPRPSSPTE